MASARRVSRPEAWHRRWRAELLLAAIVLLLAVPHLQPLMAQQASRYALTAAVYDQQTVVLDDYQESLTVDRAVRNGQLYSDKAPGQPFWAIPAYAVYRFLGGEPATIYRPWGNLGLWAASVWSAAIPAAVLAVLMRRFAQRVAPRQATVAALAMAVATLLLPFSTVLFSHVLAAAVALGGYLLLIRKPATPRTLAGAGALAGWGVTIEYTGALIVLVLLVVAVVRHGRRSGWFMAGGVPLGLFLAAYQWVAFGGPFAFSYNFAVLAKNDTGGLVGVHMPRPGMAWQITFGERGLFLLTPIVLFGLVGTVLLLRKWRARPYAIVALAVFGLFWLHMAGWGNATGGASPGPRYAVAGLPFLVIGVAEAWRRWPVAGWAATAIGAGTMGLATFTLPLAPRNVFALAYWWERAQQGEWAQTLLTRPFGTWALLLPVLMAVALAARLLVGESRDPALRDRVTPV